MIYKIILILAFASGAYAQCVVPPGFLCITQAEGDKASTLADRYKALKEAFDAATKQIAAYQVSSVDGNALIAKLKDKSILDDAIEGKQEQLRVLQESIIKFYMDLTDRMQKQMAKGKSGFGKVLDALKATYYIVATVMVL